MALTGHRSVDHETQASNRFLFSSIVVVYWQKCGQRNRDTTRIAVKNKT